MSGVRYLVIVLVSALVVTAAAAARRGGAHRDQVPGVHVLWRTPVGGHADALAVGRGGVWVATGASPQATNGRLLRIDARSGRRTASIPVGWWPSSVAVGAGGVWVADSIGDGSRLKHHLPGLENAVTRFDPATDRVRATIRLPWVESLAVADGAVWATVLAGDAELVDRIDPGTDRVVARIRLPGADGPLGVGGGRIWALTWFADPSEHARIYEIDPRSNRVIGSVVVPQAGPFSSLAYARGVLWVGMVNPGSSLALRGRVVRIDPRRKHRLGRAMLVPGATALASNQAGVWAVGNRFLVSLESGTGMITHWQKLGADVPETAQSIAAVGRTVWLLAGSTVWATSSPRSVSTGDYGFLRRFAPQSPTTWWAVVESNLKPETFVVRTTDGGQQWREVTPPVKLVSSSFFLGSNAAWIEADALHPPRTEPVYRTLDGGRSWQRLARVPTGCQLDFVDEQRGWCALVGAAAGSSTVRLYRTSDGGSTWRLVSRTGLYDVGSTRDALPYGCDKTITFTSPTVGWTSSFCAGTSAYLYASKDGGSHWHALPRVPPPKRAPTPEGEGLSAPAVTDSDIAVAVEIGGNPGVTAIATSSDGGRTWRSRLVPVAPKHSPVDLIDPQHWRLTDGTTLLATDDGGRHWHRWTPVQTMRGSLGTPLTLNFLTPRFGFAVPDANGGPLWLTHDGGATWQPITITAGPFTLPR
jgi:virginiamycin B lyase